MWRVSTAFPRWSQIGSSAVVRAQEPVVGAHRDIYHREVATLVMPAAGGQGHTIRYVWTRADLLQPVYALGKELEARGAKVMVLKLPVNTAGGKMGLDDYLCARAAGALERLPRLGLKHPVFTRTASWWREWTKRGDETPAGREPGPIELLQRLQTVPVLHPAHDVADGVLWYGLPVDGALVLITSTRQAYRADQLPEGIALRHTDPGPSTVSRDVAVRWLTGGESGSLARAIDGLADFFARYVVLKDGRAAFLLGAWTLATWCSRVFRVRGSFNASALGFSSPQAALA